MIKKTVKEKKDRTIIKIEIGCGDPVPFYLTILLFTAVYFM